MNKLVTLVLTALFSLTITVQPVLAVNVPNFPSCAAPSGQVIASYPDGVHGIVGSANTYTGNDTVYQLSDSTLIQCFCGPDGQGVQTNWWKASSLTEEEIEILKSQGWYYIPDGSLWGLANDPYVAQNISYNCQPGKPGSNDNPNRSGGGSGIGGGDILAASTGDVLGLAATGDSALVYGVFGSSILFLLIGIARIRKSKSV